MSRFFSEAHFASSISESTAAILCAHHWRELENESSLENPATRPFAHTYRAFATRRRLQPPRASASRTHFTSPRYAFKHSVLDNSYDFADSKA